MSSKETLTPAKPEQHLNLFPTLPFDIRRHIWKLCIPHRVVDIDKVWNDYPVMARRRKPHVMGWETDCQGLFLTSQRNSCAPIITAVCRESRDVYFEGRVQEYKLSESARDEFLHFVEDQRIQWFNPATDIIILNAADQWFMQWSQDQDNFHDYTPGDPVDEFVRVALSSKGASVHCDLIHYFDLERIYKSDYHPCYPDFDFEWRGEGFESIETLKTCSVVIQMVPLHVSRSAALESGLFGRLGEELIVLVNPADKCALQNFHRLWLSGPPDLEPEKFFKVAVEAQQFQEAAEHWQYESRAYWLKFKCYQAVRNGTLRQEEVVSGGSSMWYSREEWKKQNIRPTYDAGPGANWQGLFDEEHPFVRKVMEEMPRFEPVVMFRLCEKSCYEDE